MLGSFVTKEKFFFGGLTALSAYQLTRMGSLSKAGKLYTPIGLGVGIVGFMIASRARSSAIAGAQSLDAPAETKQEA